MAVSTVGSFLEAKKEPPRDGYGVYVYPNSFFRYEGEWKQGKKHGHGKLLFKDGSYYEGEFTDGEIVGNGLRYWASTGHGLLTDKDGQTYQGSYHKNKRHGGGKMVFKNGDEYEGDWILDQRQGHGVLRCADGTIYEGQWRNDKFNGQGSIIHCSGATYAGRWLNGYPVGQAKKIVILGPEVIDTVPGYAHTLHVQLQDEEGELSESESGRLLEISAGIRKEPLPAIGRNSLPQFIAQSKEQPVESSLGSEHISYPLKMAAFGSQEPQASLPAVGPSGFALSELPIPEGSLGPKSGSKPWDGAGDALGDRDGVGNESCRSPGFQRTECGRAVFKNIRLVPPLEDPRPTVPSGETPQKGDTNPSDQAHLEPLTTFQEMAGDTRFKVAAAGCNPGASRDPPGDLGALPGDYVVMVRDVTSPPFLGRRLPPAFKLLRVLSERGKRTGSGEETQQGLGSSKKDGAPPTPDRTQGKYVSFE
ncbi:MORN repeat-containing protein 1 isoform X2 [Hemicordylus capensis]|uniref:MORN repeat-containing protein 1 isoform X2 n=1 Tax=Hemicordylus capensis TaxID=884348 RepID=UPI0023042B4A|nr:MORN repeat-containing protein 1 isoform X2 [Hemicordylus capensis]